MDTEILKRGWGHQGLGMKDAPQWLGATHQKILKIRPLDWLKVHMRSVMLNYLSLQKFVNVLMK